MGEEMTYSLIRWPEIQDYMDHPRWNECFDAQRIDESDSESYWFVPDDIVAEVEWEKLKKEDFVFDGMVFTRAFTDIKRGDIVCFINDEGKQWISKCITPGLGSLPDLFEGNEMPGINCYIDGVKI